MAELEVEQRDDVGVRAAPPSCAASAVVLPNGLSHRTALPAAERGEHELAMAERRRVDRDEVDVGIRTERGHRVGVAG